LIRTSFYSGPNLKGGGEAIVMEMSLVQRNKKGVETKRFTDKTCGVTSPIQDIEEPVWADGSFAPGVLKLGGILKGGGKRSLLRSKL